MRVIMFNKLWNPSRARGSLSASQGCFSFFPLPFSTFLKITSYICWNHSTSSPPGGEGGGFWTWKHKLLIKNTRQPLIACFSPRLGTRRIRHPRGAWGPGGRRASPRGSPGSWFLHSRPRHLKQEHHELSANFMFNYICRGLVLYSPLSYFLLATPFNSYSIPIPMVAAKGWPL